MDPFEVRIRFTGHLQHLNATVTSANKAAQYALKYRDMDEDLHSCILEQIEKVHVPLTSPFTFHELQYLVLPRGRMVADGLQNSMNNRANIMYFVEHLCDMAAREDHYDYVRMMQRDILRIVDAAAPEDGSGAANVKVVRKVLQALQQKSFLLGQTVQEIEELLKERDTLPDAVGLSSPLGPGMADDVHMSGTTPIANSQSKAKTNGVMGVRLDKKQIEQRIEEDRERHKRQRENVWAIPKPVSGGTQAISDAEFEDMWENTSDLGEDDFDLYAEEAEERRKAAREWKEEFFATLE
jgi:CTD kinase subunit gamma